MVGRMREQALALRRTLFERANDEMYEVGLGAELSRLLPHELLALRHPLLRRDFARRFVDAELLQYALRASRGEGPRADDRLPRRQLVDGRRQGDLVEGGVADAARHRAAPAPAVPLDLLRLRRHAAAGARPQRPAALRRRACSKVFELAEYFPGRRHRLPEAAERGARVPAAGAPPPRRHRLHHRRRMPRRRRVAERVQARQGTSSASRCSPCSSTSAPARSAR